MNEKPIGEGDYVVRAGDGMSSIAEAHGHFWETLWNEAANAALKRARKNPEILRPGDRVTIPPLREKKVDCQTGRRHRFRRRGVPVRILFELRDRRGRAFANVKYRLRVGDRIKEGQTDAKGALEEWITPTAHTGELTFWPARRGYPEAVTWTVQIGHLLPIDTMDGVRQRLTNLGLPCGAEQGASDDQTAAAIFEFQRRNALPETGEVDGATRSKLLEAHGS